MPAAEAIVLMSIVALHALVGLVAVLQLGSQSQRCRSLLWPLVLVGVLLDAVWLGLRALAIGAIPLTDTCEACIFLALVFGLLYLLFGPSINRVWFGSVMGWALLGLVLTAVAVSEPPVQVIAFASTPLAVGHAAIMVLAAAAVMFAAANSVLYLLASRRLKRKEVVHVLGRIPNMETLGRMNRVGLGAGFVLLTVGLITGLRLASSLGTGIASWLMDGKVVSIVMVWGLLGTVLVLDRLALLKERCRACATLLAFVLVVFAIVGTAVTGITRHEFSRRDLPMTPTVAV